ncbi:hypothetical protein [Roseovarius sp. D22-M7]|uniref:hypothetical protein n=1 Tax=Roseovarius sp. D22-M7 TaxID=3127116 RepID=UPI0030104DEC
MEGDLKRSGARDVTTKYSSKSSRASRLYHLQKEARKIREEHAAGKISAEEAAERIRNLSSSSTGIFFHTPITKVSA